MKSEALQKVLNAYDGGKKCASAIRLTPGTDFSKLTASQLKGIIKDKGIDCKACSEKGDFVKRLQQYVAEQAGSSGAHDKTEL